MPKQTARQRSASLHSVASNTEIHSLQEAFEQLDVHALKFVFLTRSCLLRTVWFLLFVGGCAAAGYNIRQIIVEFLTHQTATKISTKIQEEYDFPPIYICPRHNWNLAKAQQLNLSMDAVIHAALLGQRNDSHNPLPSMEDDPILVEDRLHKFIRRNSDIPKKTYADFFKYMALNSQQIIQESAGIRSTGFSSVFVASPNPNDNRPVNYRACYNVSAGKYNPHNGDVFYLQYAIDKPSNESAGFGYDSDFAFIKDDHRIVLEKDRIYLRTNRVTTIRLSVKEYMRRETKESKCRKPEDVSQPYSQEYCRFRCYARAVEKCTKCKLLFEDTELIGAELLCTWMSVSNLTINCPEAKPKSYKNCLTACEPLCEYKTYDFSAAVTVLNASFYLDPRIALWIYFLVDDGVLVYEEIPIYNIQTLISNIGGQMGLWTGASILTIIELVYLLTQFFCADWEIRKVKRRRRRGELSARSEEQPMTDRESHEIENVQTTTTEKEDEQQQNSEGKEEKTVKFDDKEQDMEAEGEKKRLSVYDNDQSHEAGKASV